MILILIFVVVFVLVIVYLLFGSVEKEIYDPAVYEGVPTNAFPVQRKELMDWIKSRDENNFEEKKFGTKEEFVKILRSDEMNGLVGNDFIERRKHFGINKYKSLPVRLFREFWFETLEDKTLRILMASSIVSIILGVTVDEDPSTGWIEGAAIFFAVMLVSLVTAANDYSKDRKFRQLSAIHKDKKVKVIRNGKPDLISIYDVLVGDVITLETGDYIPADGFYLNGHGCAVNESSMTGEPLPIKKSEKNPFFISGCMVVEGVTNVLVLATGMNSTFGQLKAMIEKEGESTPLQEKLDELADFIGKCGASAAACTFVALLLKWAVLRFILTSDGWDWHQLSVIVEFVITAITIVAVAVPEGLPLAVTISLAYSMMKMMKDQNLVRHLAACETMGGATQICSDKTGTLTQNKMTVTDGWIADSIGGDANIVRIVKSLPPEKLDLFVTALSVNSSANIVLQEGKETFTGAPTEIALLQLLRSAGIDYAEKRAALKPFIAFQYPFSSSLKRMTTVLGNDKMLTSFVKGASEVVLKNCVNYTVGENEKPIDEIKREQLLQYIDQWASRGLRTLSIAYRHLEKVVPPDVTQEFFENDLTLVAIVGISDPVRPEVPDAVKRCQQAGIKVRMLTGDNALTAADIGRQCGIKSPEGVVLEGPAFRKLSDDEIDDILPKLEVIARCSPEDKLKLVRRLKSTGEVVAVTGDGTNDAPQLREADVGFAMGISGTEVAKDASDIILLDDNFTSIVKAALWGRNVYDSIRKFIQFQLTVNICAVVIAFVGAVTTGESPLRAVQLLWVNLIMDTFAALALATDSPSPKLLMRPPHGRNSPLISRGMWNFIVGSALFQMSILFSILYSGSVSWLGISDLSHDDTRTTILFNTFVFLQLWNEINSRKLDDSNIFEGILSNPIFISIMILTVFVQFLLVQFGGAFSHTVPLSVNQWLFCIGVGSFSIPVAYVLRRLPPFDFPFLRKETISPKQKFADVGKNVLQRVRVQKALQKELEKSRQATDTLFIATLRSSRVLRQKVVIT